MVHLQTETRPETETPMPYAHVNGLDVYLEEENAALHAEYDVTIRFPFDKHYTRHFDVVSSVSAGIAP